MTKNTHTDTSEVTGQSLLILSSLSTLEYFDKPPKAAELVDVVSDLKPRIFPRPFERLSKLRGFTKLVGAEERGNVESVAQIHFKRNLLGD